MTTERGEAVRRVARRFVPRRARAALARKPRRLPPIPADPDFDFQAPACPEGMVTAPPDFVGIGAPRSGTSWWFTLLNRHPGIHSARGHKELHFLNRFVAGEPSPDEVAAYAQWFPRPPGEIAGEWTPDYMVHCWLGPVLARMAPAAKVVVMLRDPVDRYCSGISQDLRPQGVRPGIDAVNRFHGFYGEHLARLAPHVAEGALLVLQYERCVREPQHELERTYRFLGVEPVEVRDAGARESRRGKPYELFPERRSLLVEAYRPDVERLTTCYPEIDISLWKNFA